MSEPRPNFNPRGMPEHGAAWGAHGVVLRARSRGPGVPVPVKNPRWSNPTRVLSGSAKLGTMRGALSLTSDDPEGKEYFVIVEVR